jgi:pimeloyl-ACP methyl ester carboxylesterase
MPSAANGYIERTYVCQDNLTLYYRDYGSHGAERAALLCLPGLTRNSKDFHELALRYAVERRVVCPDYRGRGRSEHDPEWRRYNARVLLADVQQLLAASNLHKVVVVGTSLGGLLAMGLAVAEPRMLAGVVLNDVGPDIDYDGLGQIVDWVSQDRPQPDYETAALYLKQHASHIGVRDDAGWLRLARNTWHEGADGRLHFDYDFNLVRPVAELVETRGAGMMDLWPMFRALYPIPTTLLRGENSDLLGRETVSRMIEAKPDLEFVEVAGAGHVPQLDEPESLEAIDALLARL